ncbi:MAG: hypothetical protein AAFV86_11705 [Pseudomonadota bacterium]
MTRVTEEMAGGFWLRDGGPRRLGDTADAPLWQPPPEGVGRAFWQALIAAPFVAILALVVLAVGASVLGDVLGPMTTLQSLAYMGATMAFFGAPVSLPSFWIAGGLAFRAYLGHRLVGWRPTLIGLVLVAALANLAPAAVAWLVALGHGGVEAAAEAATIMLLGGMTVGMANVVAFWWLYRRHPAHRIDRAGHGAF